MKVIKNPAFNGYLLQPRTEEEIQAVENFIEELHKRFGTSGMYLLKDLRKQEITNPTQEIQKGNP